MDSKDSAGANTAVESRRESRKRANRNRILRTAEEVFLQKGFSATTTDEIAEQAGVTKRTLYKYFPSKIALYVGMFDYYLHRLSVEISKTAGKSVPPDRLVMDTLTTLFRFTRKNEKFMRLYWMLDSGEFEGAIPEELIVRVNDRTRAMFDEVLVVINKARDNGVILDVDPSLLVHLMSAINKGIFTHASKEKRLEIADIGPEKLFGLLKIILKNGLFRKNM